MTLNIYYRMITNPQQILFAFNYPKDLELNLTFSLLHKVEIIKGFISKQYYILPACSYLF